MTVGDPIARAEALIEFCDGLEAAGFPALAMRGRIVARDVLDLAEKLQAERSVRAAVQGDRDRLRGLLTSRSVETNRAA